MGGPAVARWVDTDEVLAQFRGDRRRYQSYVEGGRGEKPVDPFERAVAGLVLGGEAFVERIRRIVKDLPEDRDIPSITKLTVSNRPTAEEVEAAVEKVFAGVATRRKGRLLLYALRRHTSLRGTEIARRYARTPAAVSVAARAILTEASRSRALALGLRKLATALRHASEVDN